MKTLVLLAQKFDKKLTSKFLRFIGIDIKIQQEFNISVEFEKFERISLDFFLSIWFILIEL